MKPAEFSKKDYLAILQSHPLFALLPDTKTGQAVKDELVGQVSFHEYAKGELIFIQHSTVESLYFLLKGQVVCHRELPSGQACLIAYYDDVGLINENVLWGFSDETPKFGRIFQDSKTPTPTDTASHIANKHSTLLVKERGIHQLTATTKEVSLVATLSVQAYFESIRKFELGSLLMWFCDTISKRMYYHLISSDLLAFVQAKSKLSYYLLTHYPVGVPFELPFSQKQLASQIGLRPETLSRTLKDFIKAGFITKHKSHYCLTDAEKLLSLVSE